LRPFYFGHGPQLGLGKAKRYIFGCAANPVGNYYPNGVKPAKSVVLKGYDRASPFGVGDCKTAGNYAADVVPSSLASARGFTVVLYLDAAEHKYVEEFSTSNFVAISKDGKTFVTPDSHSILGSITRFSLETLAKDAGLQVERRKVDFSEVSSFREVAACGTGGFFFSQLHAFLALTLHRHPPPKKNLMVQPWLLSRLRALLTSGMQITSRRLRLGTASLFQS